MSEDYRDMLIGMMTAPTLEATVSLSLLALRRLVDPVAVALLLWDPDLDRYIIGEVYTTAVESAPEFRRLALPAALAAHQHNVHDPRCLESGLYYEPLSTPEGRHVGAYIYRPGAMLPPVHAETYRQLMHATTRALWMMTRIELADREHAQLIDERERLKQLLYAVDQQQQTIDRLLTLERQFSASLEAEVQERTAALRQAQARIIHSEKLAVIGQLAASLAHEINNPLQAIQSGMGLIIAELDSGQITNVDTDLRLIQAELERVQLIFRQMLDFNRPTSAQREPLDVNAICEGVRVLLRKQLQDSGVVLHLELVPQLPTPVGDSNQIKQVLINLVLNGAEAISSTPGEIIIRTHHTAQQVQIAVSDDGCGIRAEHLPRLFEPFFTTRTRGLGLGLAIWREIVEKHGGEITVCSQVGQGTTFTIILPAEEHRHVY